jgi:hypothetical protein
LTNRLRRSSIREWRGTSRSSGEGRGRSRGCQVPSTGDWPSRQPWKPGSRSTSRPSPDVATDSLGERIGKYGDPASGSTVSAGSTGGLALAIAISVVPVLLSSTGALALVGCTGATHDAIHAYSDVLMTCYNANGIAATWNPSAGSWYLDSSGGAHVNGDVQVVTDPGPQYQVEVGWWYGYMYFCACNETCFYGAQRNGGGYGDTCGVYTGFPVGPNRFHIEYVGSSKWAAIVGVTTIFTSVGQNSYSERINAGMEEQASTFPSANGSPLVNWGSLQFSDPASCGVTCISWQGWTPYSYCLVQYQSPYFEGFTAGTFPSGFNAAIGKSLSPPNPPCNGSYPAPPGNTTWRG